MAGAPINTGNFALDLYPEVLTWFGLKYKQFPSQHDQVFKVMASDRGYERIAKVGELGLPSQFSDGESVSFDSMAQRWKLDVTHRKYGIGFIITKDALDDQKSGIPLQLKSYALARSMSVMREILAASYLDNCFTGGTSTGGDGVVLYSASHPLATGTFSNVPSSPVAISEAGLEQACKDIENNFVSERGLKIMAKARKLVIHPNLRFEAIRILQSQGQVYTPDNTPNALKASGLFPESFTTMNYLNSTNAYHILTDVEDQGLIEYVRREPDVTTDNVFDNENAKFKSVMRLSFCHGDPRCAYGVYNA